MDLSIALLLALLAQLDQTLGTRIRSSTSSNIPEEAFRSVFLMPDDIQERFERLLFPRQRIQKEDFKSETPRYHNRPKSQRLMSAAESFLQPSILLLPLPSKVEESSLESSAKSDGNVRSSSEEGFHLGKTTERIISPFPTTVKRTVRRCGIMLIKHLQSVCNGCLKGSPDAEQVTISKRSEQRVLFSKRDTAGFSKITDICCTQRSCTDDEIRPFCCQ